MRRFYLLLFSLFFIQFITDSLQAQISETQNTYDMIFPFKEPASYYENFVLKQTNPVTYMKYVRHKNDFYTALNIKKLKAHPLNPKNWYDFKKNLDEGIELAPFVPREDYMTYFSSRAHVNQTVVHASPVFHQSVPPGYYDSIAESGFANQYESSTGLVRIEKFGYTPEIKMIIDDLQRKWIAIHKSFNKINEKQRAYQASVANIHEPDLQTLRDNYSDGYEELMSFIESELTNQLGRYVGKQLNKSLNKKYYNNTGNFKKGSSKPSISGKLYYDGKWHEFKHEYNF